MFINFAMRHLICPWEGDNTWDICTSLVRLAGLRNFPTSDEITNICLTASLGSMKSCSFTKLVHFWWSILILNKVVFKVVTQYQELLSTRRFPITASVWARGKDVPFGGQSTINVCSGFVVVLHQK